MSCTKEACVYQRMCVGSNLFALHIAYSPKNYANTNKTLHTTAHTYIQQILKSKIHIYWCLVASFPQPLEQRLVFTIHPLTFGMENITKFSLTKSKLCLRQWQFKMIKINQSLLPFEHSIRIPFGRNTHWTYEKYPLNVLTKLFLYTKDEHFKHFPMEMVQFPLRKKKYSKVSNLNCLSNKFGMPDNQHGPRRRLCLFLILSETPKIEFLKS